MKNFLPELLDSGFRLVYQDCQDARANGILNWLRELRRLLEKALQLPASAWQPPPDWLSAWAEMQAFLEALMQDKNYRLILAFDEYETLHHDLRTDPQTGGRLQFFPAAEPRGVFVHRRGAVFRIARAQLEPVFCAGGAFSGGLSGAVRVPAADYRAGGFALPARSASAVVRADPGSSGFAATDLPRIGGHRQPRFEKTDGLGGFGRSAMQGDESGNAGDRSVLERILRRAGNPANCLANPAQRTARP